MSVLPMPVVRPAVRRPSRVRWYSTRQVWGIACAMWAVFGALAGVVWVLVA